MKPYISAQLDALNATGRPFNRPLMWDFPEDPRTWQLAEQGLTNATDGIADQYMMVDDYMVAPILQEGQRSRAVYFPKGANWVHYFTQQTYNGGTTAMVNSPLEHFPLFKRTPLQIIL